MTLRVRDLTRCFEGVIPSIIGTAAPDGTPNISYLSHVVLVDDERVALSNQFFSKTASNVRANPRATVLVVDPRDGGQYRLDVTFEETVDRGDLFDEMAVQLRATSAQVGMSEIMRLRGVDLYRVKAVHPVPTLQPSESPTLEMGAPLTAAAVVARRVSEATEVGAIVDAILEGLCDTFASSRAMLLLKEAACERLVTVGTRGYERSGIGSEVLVGAGIIGMAASEQRPVRVSDMSRVRRFNAAVQGSSDEENRTRTIALPELPDAMSQIALPMIAHGALRGVLFLESSERLAYTKEHEAALAMLALQTAAAINLAEVETSEGQTVGHPATEGPATAGQSFQVVHHAYDDSIFIDNEYLIKGVAGRLLMHMLRIHQREGRVEFTNREIRLTDQLRLPDIKDNLETRLLLLRRRLEEKASPVQLRRVSRGRFRLDLAGPAVLEEAAGCS